MTHHRHLRWILFLSLFGFGFLSIACGDGRPVEQETSAETTGDLEKSGEPEQISKKEKPTQEKIDEPIIEPVVEPSKEPTTTEDATEPQSEIASESYPDEPGPPEDTDDGGSDRASDASEKPELPNPETPQCTANKPCEKGLICDSGSCRGCNENSECSGTTLCLGGVCRIPECTNQNPCPNGRLCQKNACVDCLKDSECGTNQICVTGGCVAAQCSDASDCKDSIGKTSGKICKERRCRDCTDDSSCGADKICENQRCQTGCRNDNGCASSTRCDTIKKSCVDCLGRKDCQQGELCTQNKCVRCKADDECGLGQLCIQDQCILGNCRTRSDCKTTGQLCKQYKCSGCINDGECGKGQICTNKLCQPGCRTNNDCGTNQVCDTVALVCKGCLKASDCQTGQLCKNNQCTTCNKDSECGQGKLCVNRVCIPGACRTHSDCSSGKVCIRYQCTTCSTDLQCGSGMLCLNKVCKPGQCRTDKECKGKLCKSYQCVACKNNTECGGQLCKSGVCTPCQSNKECGDGQLVVIKKGPVSIKDKNPVTVSFSGLPLGQGELTLSISGEIPKANITPVSTYLYVIADGVEFGVIKKNSRSTKVLVTASFKLSTHYIADGKLTVKLQPRTSLPFFPMTGTFTINIVYASAKLCLGGICKVGNCSKTSDCGPKSCTNVVVGCSERAPQCLQNKCSFLLTSRKNAICSNQQCLIFLGHCKESQLGSSMATTTYNSDKDKPQYLSASGMKYIKSWTDSGKDAHGFHAVSTHSGLSMCHYAFRGLPKITSLSGAYAQIKSINNLVRVTCKTPAGKTIGSCISGAQERYQALQKKGIITDLIQRVKAGKCNGGLRIHGHSMGGAIASIVAAGLYVTDSNLFTRSYMRLTTYGAPRVFKDSNANNYHSKLACYRWTTSNDHIPGLLGGSNKHFGSTYEIKKSGSNYTYNSKGQDYAPKWDPTKGLDHNSLNYFNRLKSCQ